MTKEEFISNYPTPDYVVTTWKALHVNFCSETMLAWEDACARAMREATEAYERSTQT